MTTLQTDGLKHHFLSWSGGFEPESRDQITVYLDYAILREFDRDEARQALEEWMNSVE